MLKKAQKKNHPCQPTWPLPSPSDASHSAAVACIRVPPTASTAPPSAHTYRQSATSEAAAVCFPQKARVTKRSFSRTGGSEADPCQTREKKSLNSVATCAAPTSGHSSPQNKRQSVMRLFGKTCH